MKKLVLLLMASITCQYLLATEVLSDSTQVTALNLNHGKAAKPDLIFLPPTINQDYNAVVSQVSSFSNVTREEFRTPLQFVFSVEKRLGVGEDKRLTLGVGAGILMVNSTLDYQNYNISIKEEISRSYLTVPVYLKYDYLQDSRVRLFASVGLSSEFGLNARIKRESYTSGNLTNAETVNEDLYSGQFNLSIGSGINVKIAKHFSLFTEAAVAHYYFESTRTIWSDKGLWFNLKSGINFQF